MKPKPHKKPHKTIRRKRPDPAVRLALANFVRMLRHPVPGDDFETKVVKMNRATRTLEAGAAIRPKGWRRSLRAFGAREGGRVEIEEIARPIAPAGVELDRGPNLL